MTRWTCLIALTLVALLPAPALATICFQLAPFSDVVVLEIHGDPVGGFYSLIGEDVGPCGPTTSMPLVGTAHLRADGKAHIGLVVNSANDDGVIDCRPFTIQGTLDPPSFNSGAGFIGSSNQVATAITFTSAACPALPQ